MSLGMGQRRGAWVRLTEAEKREEPGYGVWLEINLKLMEPTSGRLTFTKQYTTSFFETSYASGMNHDRYQDTLFVRCMVGLMGFRGSGVRYIPCCAGCFDMDGSQSNMYISK